MTVVVTTKTEDNKNIEIQFNESFKYNNIQDKFELAQSENEIKNNLAETIVRRLISELKNF